MEEDPCESVPLLITRVVFVSVFLFGCSQDNWDDEDEDEEKKAEVTKTGTNNIRGSVEIKSCFIFCRRQQFILNFRA